MTSQEVFQAALALPDDERAQLLEQLEASFEVDIDPELLAILKEREAAFDRGEPGIPAEEVFAEARRR